MRRSVDRPCFGSGVSSRRPRCNTPPPQAQASFFFLVLDPTRRMYAKSTTPANGDHTHPVPAAESSLMKRFLGCRTCVETRRQLGRSGGAALNGPSHGRTSHTHTHNRMETWGQWRCHPHKYIQVNPLPGLSPSNIGCVASPSVERWLIILEIDDRSTLEEQDGFDPFIKTYLGHAVSCRSLSQYAAGVTLSSPCRRRRLLT